MTDQRNLRFVPRIALVALVAFGATIARAGGLNEGSLTRQDMVPLTDGAIGAVALMTEADFTQIINEPFLPDVQSASGIKVEVRGLPLGEYDLRYKGSLRTTVLVEPDDHGGTLGRGSFALDGFPVEGNLLEVCSDSDAEFGALTQGQLPAYGGFLQGIRAEKTNASATMTPVGDDDATGSLKVISKRKKIKFRVTARRLAPNTAYALRINGWTHTTFETNKRGSIGQTLLARKFGVCQTKKKGPIEFDPTGSDYEIVRVLDNAPVLAGSLAGAPVGAELERINSLKRRLTLVTAPDDAGGEAEVSGAPDDRLLRVDVEGLADGVHMVTLGADTIGVLNVTGGSGEAEFVMAPPQPGQQMLLPDPIGQHVRILDQAGNVLMGTYLPD